MRHLSILLLVGLIISCESKRQTEPTEDHIAEINAWRDYRIKYLKSEEGYVNLAGLFWLKEGDNYFGSSEDHELTFPAGKAPETLGKFVLRNDTVTMHPGESLEINFKGIQVQKPIPVYHEGMMPAPEFDHGSLRWVVIKRGQQYGVRLRDLQHPMLTSMPDIEYFDIDPNLKVEADFVPYDPPKYVKTANVLGMVYDAKVPGVLNFELGGQSFSMEPNIDGEFLHLRFTDETTEVETYGLGRYLHIKMPDENNKTIIDFNRAYNPPCAFTEFATCPIPPKENEIPFKVLGGELNYGSHL